MIELFLMFAMIAQAFLMWFMFEWCKKFKVNFNKVYGELHDALIENNVISNKLDIERKGYKVHVTRLNQEIAELKEQSRNEYNKRVELQNSLGNLTASEALYGFVGWLSTRKEALTISSSQDAAIWADKIKEFCDVNKLSEPRNSWHKNLKHPGELE